MVAVHVDNRDTQRGCDVLQVVIWQIPAPNHQIDVAVALMELSGVICFDDAIAEGQDFHLRTSSIVAWLGSVDIST